MVNIIDSSFWVALFRNNDSNHHKAVKLVDNIRGPIIIPNYVFEEVLTVLTYVVSRNVADQFVPYVLNNKNINVLINNLEEEANFFLSHQHKISFVDNTLLFLAKKHKAKLITFDKKLEKIWKDSQKKKK